MGVIGISNSNWGVFGIGYAGGDFAGTSPVSGNLVLVTQSTNFPGVCGIDNLGDLLCSGSKSAVVPVDSGTRKVALYAVEAPENWFEDFGSGALSGGVAAIVLEPTFVQTVNTGLEYHVFLTPKGDCKGLYVANETAAGFDVREIGGGQSNVRFDYRIVARRKGYESIRLADKTQQFEPPKLHPVNAPGTQPTSPQELEEKQKEMAMKGLIAQPRNPDQKVK